ncbi:hypothetical protein Fot_38416 [Forsythia ovata]|uniref:Uncharacterized protein n=1 Tax=Forsythia ovata TaxID=205694 RepID=A0ABD1S1R3_9LAMI
MRTPKYGKQEEFIPDQKEQDEDQNGFDDVLVESDYEVDEEPIGPEVHEVVMLGHMEGFFLPGQGYVGRAFPYPATRHDKEGFLPIQPQGCIGMVFPYPATRTSRESFPYLISMSGRKGVLLYPTTRPNRESILLDLVAKRHQQTT